MQSVILVKTLKFSVLTRRAPFPVAKDGAVVVTEGYYASRRGQPVVDLGWGDSAVLSNVAAAAANGDEGNSGRSLFYEVRDEVNWQQMLHKGNPVPRLVCMQGTFTSGLVASNLAEPVYRHPADDQPPMQGWSPTVARLRVAAEEALEALTGQRQPPLNHALVQWYRDGEDYISEHADKTLDVARGSAIVNLSLGATRTMVLRGKKEGAAEAGAEATAGARAAAGKARSGTRPTRATQRVDLVDGSLFVLGWETNRFMTHEIRQDRRLAQVWCCWGVRG